MRLIRIYGTRLAVVWLGGFAGVALAAPQAKDIVLSRLSAPTAQATGQRTNGMSVSVLVAGPDDALYPRATTAPFVTGERFRVRVLPTIDGTLVVANTSAEGETTELLRIAVQAGRETLIPTESDNLFQLAGNGGEDVLHLRVFPAGQIAQSAVPQGVSKDIRLVTQSTTNASYIVGAPDQSLYARVVLRHDNRKGK